MAHRSAFLVLTGYPSGLAAGSGHSAASGHWWILSGFHEPGKLDLDAPHSLGRRSRQGSGTAQPPEPSPVALDHGASGSHLPAADRVRNGLRVNADPGLSNTNMVERHKPIPGTAVHVVWKVPYLRMLRILIDMAQER